MADDWTVTDGSGEIPEEILAAAAASQATLGDKLAALRALGESFGVKDIINTRGLRTAAGSTLFADHVPASDATVVARLRDAGAIIVGKTTTPEFAFGDETGDGVRNPRPTPTPCLQVGAALQTATPSHID